MGSLATNIMDFILSCMYNVFFLLFNPMCIHCCYCTQQGPRTQPCWNEMKCFLLVMFLSTIMWNVNAQCVTKWINSQTKMTQIWKCLQSYGDAILFVFKLVRWEVLALIEYGTYKWIEKTDTLNCCCRLCLCRDRAS